MSEFLNLKGSSSFHQWDAEAKAWIITFMTSPPTKVRPGAILLYKNTTVLTGFESDVTECESVSGSLSAPSTPSKLCQRPSSSSLTAESPMKRLKLEDGQGTKDSAILISDDEDLTGGMSDSNGDYGNLR